eukprot:1150998-Pelagomonas_calceolata.AAC.3
MAGHTHTHTHTHTRARAQGLTAFAVWRAYFCRRWWLPWQWSPAASLPSWASKTAWTTVPATGSPCSGSSVLHEQHSARPSVSHLRCCTQPRGSAADVPLFSDYGVSTAPLHTAPGGAADVPRFGLPTMITVQSVILIDHTVSCLALSSPARGAPAAGLCAVCLCLCRICSLLEGPGLLMRGFRSHWAGARQAGGVDAVEHLEAALQVRRKSCGGGSCGVACCWVWEEVWGKQGANRMQKSTWRQRCRVGGRTAVVAVAMLLDLGEGTGQAGGQLDAIKHLEAALEGRKENCSGGDGSVKCCWV